MKIFDTAKLSNSEVGFLLDVTRITAYKWRTNRSKPHPVLAARVRDSMAVIERMVASKQLPLAPHLDKETRAAKLDKLKGIIKKYSSA